MAEIDDLFKRHRPQRWEDFIGQKKTVESLRKAVLTGNVSGGYAFVGPMGCGKTSAAFTFAKALNCENPPGDGNPCNECSVCVAIDKRVQPGIQATSMANDGGVGTVRDIVQKAWLKQPVKVPVRILDEAHNLSAPAFEALLDPLGEKGLKTVFILCSTKPEKFPDTIQSRIQRRKFQLVGKNLLLPHLKNVCKEEDIEATDALLEESIRKGRGSVRKTLNELEYLLKTEDEAEGNGKFGRSVLTSLATGNIRKALSTVALAENSGIDCKDLMEQTIEDLRNISLSLLEVDPSLIAPFPVNKVKEFGNRIGGVNSIVGVILILGEHLNRMVMGEDSRIQMELGLITAINFVRDYVKKAEEESSPWN